MSTTQAMCVPFDTHFRENGETVYPEGFIFAIAIGKYEKKNKQTNKQKKNIKFRDWSVLNFILVFKVTTFDECTKVILKNWCASDEGDS